MNSGDEMMEKHGVIKEGLTPPEDTNEDKAKEASQDEAALEEHSTTRLRTAVEDRLRKASF